MILWQIFMVGTVWCWCQQISQDIAIIVITKVVEMLLGCGANPDSRDHDGESAVHAAVREESAQMLQILLKVADQYRDKTNTIITINLIKNVPLRLVPTRTCLHTWASSHCIWQLSKTCSPLFV